MDFHFDCSRERLGPKDFRRIFKALSSGASTPESVLALRANAVCKPSFIQSFAAIELHGNELLLVMPGFSPIHERKERAHSAPTMDSTLALGSLGSLAPALSGAARLASFLERRGRSDWASEARSLSGSPAFGDPLILSMLRLVSPPMAPLALDNLLFRFCLAHDAAGAASALALGADPLRAPCVDAGLSWKPHPMNLLGAVLSRHCGNPFYYEADMSVSTPYADSDEHILGAAILALSATAPQDAPALLRLAPQRSAQARKRSASTDIGQAPSGAFDLALRHGLLHCCRYFLSLGLAFPDPLPSLAAFGPPGSARLDALSALLASDQARLLSESIPAPARRRSVPRV